MFHHRVIKHIKTKATVDITEYPEIFLFVQNAASN